MKRTLFKTLATAGAAALLLSGCGLVGGDDDSGDDTGNGDGGGNAVYDAMTTWDACEVLNNLQPITDYMGIEGYGGGGSTGNLVPSTIKIGNTWDPDAIGCGDLIYLGDYKGFGMSGEIKVKIVPTESEEQAATTYEDRIAAAESSSGQWTEVVNQEISDPWDSGEFVAGIGSAEKNIVEIVARDGQWVFHIQLHYAADYGVVGGSDPHYSFTDEELQQWFVNTYLPEVNQIVNDRIVEVQ